MTARRKSTCSPPVAPTIPLAAQGIVLAGLIAWALTGLGACVQEPPGTLLPCPPALADAHPSDGETGVDITDTISVTFSTPMDSATINDTTFIVTTPGAFGGPDTVPGTVVYVPEDTAAWFIPDDTLRPETPYTVTLTTDILDTAGNPLDSVLTWTFTTDVPPPSTPSIDTTDFGDPEKLLVTWHQASGATSYHLQVSTSPLFTTLVNDQPAIPDPSFFIVSGYVPATAVPAGTYYWRVSATGPGGTSAWSNVKSFVSGYN